MVPTGSISARDASNAIWSIAEPRIAASTSLEGAAQKLVDAVYKSFADSVVLARIFLTIPFARLPESNKSFVLRLTREAGYSAQLEPQTPVLSLMGSNGLESAWQSPRLSSRHIGIPLLSREFVVRIPMIARLLDEVGADVPWRSVDGQHAKRSIAPFGRTFFVAEARSALDEQGRFIIAAQDFVTAYNVKSVFGFGGGYNDVRSAKMFAVAIVFTRDLLTEHIAARFLHLGTRFRNATGALAAAGRFFDN